MLDDGDAHDRESGQRLETVRQTPGRTVPRGELTRLCAFEVWLPDQVPADLGDAEYFVLGGVDVIKKIVPNERYGAAYTLNEPHRWLHINGGPDMALAQEPLREVRALGRLHAAVRCGETLVWINAHGLSDPEFDAIIASLHKVT